MNRLLRLRHLICICLLAVAAIGLTAKEAFATHFRYGTITWTIQNPAQPRVVTVRFTGAFRWSYPWGVGPNNCAPGTPSTGAGGCPAVGAVIPAIGSFVNTLTFSIPARVNGAATPTTSTPANLTVTSVNQAEDWLVGTMEMTLTFPDSVPFGTNVTVIYNNCCRISSLQNSNNDTQYNVQTSITLRNPINQPPTAATLPILRVAAGQTTQFVIPAIDPDGDPLTYSFVPTTMSGMTTPVPPGMTINSVTGLVTYVAPALPSGQTSQLHAVQIGVTDPQGAYTIVEMLIDRRALVGQPPVVQINGGNAAGVITTIRNAPVTFTVSASDPENTPVMLVGTGVPLGATFTPSLPLTQLNPSTTFNWTPTTSGTYVINFSGLDGEGRQATNSMTVNVANASVAAPTTTELHAFPEVALLNQTTEITAWVNTTAVGSPPGSVQFFFDGILAATQQVILAGPGQSIARVNLPLTTLGTHTVTATYVGAAANDTLYQTSTAAPFVISVLERLDTVTTLTVPTNPTVFGQPVVLTALVRPPLGASAVPDGSVLFFLNGTDVGTAALSNFRATLSLTELPVGTHTIFAVYNAGQRFNASMSESLSQVVTKANTTTTLSTTPNPSTWPQPVTITATVAPVAPGGGVPSGTVTFSLNGNAVTTVPLTAGQATIVNPAALFPAFDAGNNSLTAVYNGDGNFVGSNSALTHTVQKAAAEMWFSGPSMSTYGEPTPFTITVGPPGNSTRQVRLYHDGGAIAGPVVVDTSHPDGNFSKTFTVANLNVGDYTLRAEVLDTPNVAGGTRFISHSVQPAQTGLMLHSSLVHSVVGEPLELWADVSRQSPPVMAMTSGTVTFYDGDTVIAGPIDVDAFGVARVTIPNGLLPGNRLLSATYTPTSSNYTPSGSSFIQFSIAISDFSQPFAQPDGACICTPQLRGDQRWFVKALGGQPLTVAIDGDGAFTIWDRNGEVGQSVANPAAGAIYRVETTGNDYRLRIDGAEAAAMSTWIPDNPATSIPYRPNEVSAAKATKWYFNTAPGEAFDIAMNATEAVAYRLTNPLNQTVNGTAIGNTNISGAAVPNGGTWTLLVPGENSPTAFISFTTQDGSGDPDAYLAWDSAGEGSLRLNVTARGQAYATPVTFTITGPNGVGGTQPTDNGEIFLSGLPAGTYQIAMQVPAGWSTATPVFTVEVLCGDEVARVVELTDTTAPVVTVPGNATVEATSASGASHTFDASVSDGADPSVTVVCTPPSGTTFELGMTTVSCSATDASGNGASGSFIVTVSDTTAPAIAPIADIAATATSASGAPVTFTASATDAVTMPPAITYSHAPGSTFPVGTTTVTVTAKDAAGNTSIEMFDVTVSPLPYSANARARLRRGPTVNSGRINGSVWVMQPENVTLNGNATIAGDLILPGTPQLTRNGSTTLGATVDGFGTAAPASHRLTLNGGTSLGRLVRRVDGMTLTPVAAPPSPTGTRNVQLNRAGDSTGSFTTIRDLTLNGSVGTIAVPGGTYGTFTANGSNVLRLGVAGSTTPTVYNFQQLVLNGTSRLEVVGPVIVTVRQTIQVNGSMGNAAQPAWLDLRISNGGLTLNGTVSVYAIVDAPGGDIVVNGGTKLVGRITADRLTLNGGALLDLVVPFP